ncbi:chemotaxis protein CheX [Sulfurimonas sp.]|jgi:hypothetical protein|uniref:chemotaxis protein CheX n=1 Tax=Sulfurimonas sp. TaxID=2022749 RepID=UPI0025E28573|nr:chemotaxis protein CheX [Sulfurimonas sp.]MCK9473934.1 chemotaxis protein CheX [Sulfurimonas sp.]
MLNTIIEASKNFCIHQVRLSYELHDNVAKMRTVIAYIDIQSINGTKYRVYIGATLSFAQRISTLLLEEDESDEETLIDMTLETANLIVGSAKVLASKNPSESYTMSIPHFEKIDIFDFNYDKAKVLKIEDDEMIIAIKEL